ncbi:MAG: 2,4-dihydroxyhept-2-ene-1,7-dioic acid aldolase [Chloroflexi bacterium]|nr:2,4-dihydroxyhept-2-ene-1,7-dioic acid aldolase [Chloroflexota bacterium]
MKTNTALRRMRQGLPAIGAGATLGSPFAAELLTLAGFDYVMVDVQHGNWDDEAILLAFQLINLGSATPMIRVPQNDFYAIGRALDRGALGIVVPMVNSVAEAEAVARACRYPPRGGRSFGPFATSLYGSDYATSVDGELFVAVQIESKEAAEQAEAILSVDGIDGCWVGPEDLARSLGADVSTPAGLAARERAIAGVLHACRNTGKIPGIACGLDARDRIAQGFLYIRAGADQSFINASAAETLKLNRSVSS